MSRGRATAGVVLTGGSSTRMGTDKAFVPVGGRPMVVRVADALWEGGCHPVICQGGDVERLAELGLEAVADSQAGAGPASAIGDALGRATGPIVIAACDLADLDGPAVRSLVEAVRSHDDADVAVAVADGRRHLLTCWAAEAGSKVTALLDAGVRSFAELVDGVRAVDVAVPSSAVRNVNRPDEAAP